MSGDSTSAYLYEPERCPFTAALRVIGGKWEGVIWWRLHHGIGRFNELRRCFPQISQKMLTQQLRALEKDGIVRRTVHPELPPRVEYELTPLGCSLEPLVLELSEWGRAYLDRSAGERE